MKRLLFFLLAWMSAVGAQFTVETTVDITLSVLKQLLSSCVYFLHSNEKGKSPSVANTFQLAYSIRSSSNLNYLDICNFDEIRR